MGDKIPAQLPPTAASLSAEEKLGCNQKLSWHHSELPSWDCFSHAAQICSTSPPCTGCCRCAALSQDVPLPAWATTALLLHAISCPAVMHPGLRAAWHALRDVGYNPTRIGTLSMAEDMSKNALSFFGLLLRLWCSLGVSAAPGTLEGEKRDTETNSSSLLYTELNFSAILAHSLWTHINLPNATGYIYILAKTQRQLGCHLCLLWLQNIKKLHVQFSYVNHSPHFINLKMLPRKWDVCLRIDSGGDKLIVIW